MSPLTRLFSCLLAIVGMFLTTGFQQPTEAIATVSGDPIPVTMFQQRVRLSRWMTAQQLRQIAQTYNAEALTDPKSPFNGQYKLISDTQGFARQVLDSLITIKLVQHEAVLRNITVTDEDTQHQIELFFGYSPDAPAPTDQSAANPTQIAEAFQANRDNYFGQAGVVAKMSQADVIATFAEQALQIKVYEAVTGAVPTQAEQTKIRHILVDTQEKANALFAQIQAGASFADVAKANSQDSTSAVQGGDLGWAPRGTYEPELDAAIWNAKPGDLIGPIQSQFGYQIVLVEDRGVQPLGQADLARARDVFYKKWLDTSSTQADVKIVDNWTDYIPADPSLADLGLPTPQP